MSALRYPPAAVAADLARGGAGAGAVALPLVVGEPAPWLWLTLAALLCMFTLYLVRAGAQAVRRYHLEEGGLRSLPGGEAVPWRSLDALELRYYCTRRDGHGGWLELRLRAGHARARIDSRLEGFDGVLARAVRAAQERGLVLTPATSANLSSLGFAVPEPRP